MVSGLLSFSVNSVWFQKVLTVNSVQNIIVKAQM